MATHKSAAELAVERQQKIDKVRKDQDNAGYGAVMPEDIRAGAKKKRVDESTNETDTEVSDHSGRWKTLTSKLGRAGHMAHGHFKKH